MSSLSICTANNPVLSPSMESILSEAEVLRIDSGEGVEKVVVGLAKSFPNIIGFKGESHKVLLVDDNVDSLTVMKLILSPLGFGIAEATDGDDALRKATEFLPNLILMDLRMPEMDGFEATRRIRQTPALKDVVVIAVSASVREETQQKSFKAGCDGFITKPIKVDRLLETVGNLLHRNGSTPL